MQPSPLPITCYIRTKNEEKRIGSVIKAVSELCSETIVVDSDSTDDTREIASALGSRVISQTWLGYGKQKRVGEEAAINDWCLDLDADEILSPELINNIRAIFKQGPTDDVYSVKLVTVSPLGNLWHDSCLVWRNKLYRKTKYRMPDHDTWDQLNLASSVNPVKLTGALYHHSFHDISDLLVKMNSASNNMARTKKLKPLWKVKIRIWFGFWIYFSKKFFKQRMYREGTYGLASAVVIALQRWLTDVKMYEQHKNLKS